MGLLTLVRKLIPKTRRKSHRELAESLCVRCLDRYKDVVEANFDGRGVRDACARYAASLEEYSEALEDMLRPDETHSSDKAPLLNSYHRNLHHLARMLCTSEDLKDYVDTSINQGLQMVVNATNALCNRSNLQVVVGLLQPPVPPNVNESTHLAGAGLYDDFTEVRRENEAMLSYATKSMLMANPGDTK
jgi:hypothetical protein